MTLILDSLVLSVGNIEESAGVVCLSFPLVSTALSLVLSVGEATVTEGSAFPLFLQASDMFSPESPVLSVGDAGGMAGVALMLSYSVSKEVTGTSPLLFIGGVECVSGRLSLPLP